MSQEVLTTETNRRQLQQIIAGLSDGVILLELDKSILWANEAALTMHGVSTIGDLGSNADEYARRFTLRYRNNHVLPPDNYPISRVARRGCCAVHVAMCSALRLAKTALTLLLPAHCRDEPGQSAIDPTAVQVAGGLQQDL